MYSDISDSEESEPDCTTQVGLEKVNKTIQDNFVHFKFIWEIKYLMLVQSSISNSTLLPHSLFIFVLRNVARCAILRQML